MTRWNSYHFQRSINFVLSRDDNKAPLNKNNRMYTTRNLSLLFHAHECVDSLSGSSCIRRDEIICSITGM